MTLPESELLSAMRSVFQVGCVALAARVALRRAGGNADRSHSKTARLVTQFVSEPILLPESSCKLPDWALFICLLHLFRAI